MNRFYINHDAQEKGFFQQGKNKNQMTNLK